MDRQQIYDLINSAKVALRPPASQSGENTGTLAASIDTEVTRGAQQQYWAEAGRMFGIDPDTKKIIPPTQSECVIAAVRSARTEATLRKRARSVRHASLKALEELLKRADKAQRIGDWDAVERIITDPTFKTYLALVQIMPADYKNGWKATRKRRGKKTSLLKLPKDWREQFAAESRGQFMIPTLIALITGCRPSELEKGVLVERVENGLYVTIQGAKVKANAGQKTRKFKLADHPITKMLMEHMSNSTEPLHSMTVKVNCGNSVSTHMRAIGNKLWPGRKESITAYSGRHAMAADCKAAIASGADPDLISKVLGHIVDKTASYYGNRFQSGGICVTPSDVTVPKEILHKAHHRNLKRALPGSFRKPHQ